jgi:autotransporter translocation and assembly factor TamB
MMKRLCFGLLGALIAVMFLAAAVLFFPPAFRFGLRTANRFLPVAVEIEAHHHVPGRLDLSGVRVETPRATLLEMANFEIHYRPLALLFGRIEVSTLELENPRVTLQRAEDGHLNLFEPSASEGREEGKEGPEDDGSWISVLAPLRIGEVRIAQGSIRFEDLVSGLSLAWDSLELEGSFSGDPLEGKLYLRRGHLEAGRGLDSTLQVSTEGHVSLVEGLVRLSGLQATMEGAAVSLNGEYSISEQRSRLDAELAELPLDRLLDVFGVGSVGVERLSGGLKVAAERDKDAEFKADLTGAFHGEQVRARIAGTLKEDDVFLESIDLTSPEVRIAGKVRLAPSSGRVNGDFSVESPVLEESLRTHGIGEMRVTGLRADGKLEGTVQAPEIRFQMYMNELSYVEPLLERLNAEGGYTLDQGLYVAGKAENVPLLGEATESGRISVRLQAGKVECEIEAEPSLQLAGRMKIEDRDTEVSVHAKGLDLSFLTEHWVRSASVLSVTGRGSFSGNLDRKETWRGEAGLDEVLCSFPDLVIKSARPIEVQIENGSLKGEASFEANGRPLSVRGTYPLVSEGRVNVAASASLALEDFLLPAQYFLPSLQAWKGDLRMQATLEGPSRAPRLHAVADLSEGSFQLVSRKEQDQDKDLEPEAEDTEDMERGLEPQGFHSRRVRMHLELDGPVAEPAGSLEVRLGEGSLNGIPLDEFLLEAESRDGRKWTPRAKVRSAESELSMEGKWEVPTGVISGEINSTELDLADLIDREMMSIQGTSRIQGTLGGTIESPRVELRAVTESLAIQDIPVGNLDTSLVYDTERLSLEGKTDTGWFEASLETEKEQAFSFRGSLEGFPIGPFLNAVRLRGWNGKASLTGELEGPVADIQRWEGNVLLKELDTSAFGDQMHLENPVSLRFSGGNVTIPETSLIAGDSRLRVKGSMGQENSLTVKGTVPLRPFGTLIPAVRFHTGKAEADLVIHGSMSSPLLDGHIHLEADQVRVAGLAYPADSIEADLRAASNRFTLQSFSANVANGELRGSGTMTLEPLAFEDVRVSLNAVPIRLSDSLVANLHGELVLEGSREDSSLRGNLRIIEARYEEDFNLVGAVLLPTRPRKVSVQKADPFLKNMRLDLRVESGPNLFVRNNVSRLVLSTNMEIRGTAAKPIPLGIVRAEEGRIFYSNKRFDITQGNLAFSDPSGGQPRLQLESKVDIRGQSREYTIYLTLMGPLDRIELELSSVPDEEREDIVFLLLTGKTRDEYYAAAEESTDMEQTAQRLAVSGLGMLFGSEIRAMTGLDTFLMERTEGEEFGVKTTVGGQFNERIDVRGVFALGSGQEVSEAQVGYLLTDTFYVVGTQRTDGSFGLDFRVRIGSR